MLNLYQSFWRKLIKLGFNEVDLAHLIAQTEKKLLNPVQGDYLRWHQAYQKLPELPSVEIMTNINSITCKSEINNSLKTTIKESLQQLIPWRKGPFDLFSVFVDSEWQSFMKWNRIQSFLPELQNKTVLDVGCGNGYYMFRMLQSEPLLLMGIDPGLLQIMQFWSVDKYIKSGACVLPLTIGQMPSSIEYFDVVFSMGVLYHRKSPIHHIKELSGCIKPSGYLVLETLIVDGDASTCLLPTSRYAQMRNVWFLPSVAMLVIMLERNGFCDIECIDITITTVAEQRTTEWMKFHSLNEFLNSDKTKTIEGYQLPKRATIVAKKNR